MLFKTGATSFTLLILRHTTQGVQGGARPVSPIRTRRRPGWIQKSGVFFDFYKVLCKRTGECTAKNTGPCHIVHRRYRWSQQRDSELKGKNDAAWHRKKAIEQTFYGLLVRVVIQHFLKTIVVQFVFEVIG